MTSDDPIDCLVEIAELSMERMNSEPPVPSGEAFILGQIAGTAMRSPRVVQRLREREPHEHDFDYSINPAGTCRICGYND